MYKLGLGIGITLMTCANIALVAGIIKSRKCALNDVIASVGMTLVVLIATSTIW